MKCPQCGKEGAKYVREFNGRKKDRTARDDFQATHNCGFKGVA